MSTAAQQPRRAPLRVPAAVGCAVLATALLLALPSAVGGDPDLGPVPRTGGAGWWAVVAVLVAQAVTVVWVSRSPVVALLGVTALPLLLAWAAPGGAYSLTAVAELAAVFLAVVARPLRRLWGALAGAGLLLATGQFVNEVGRGAGAGPAAAGAVAQAAVVVGLPLLVGLVVAARRDAEQARRNEVLALRREQDAVLAAAMSRQRTALSRELHDIAAHHLSGIAVMAAAMDRQIESDPATARRSARGIREHSRAVLDDLRRLVGLLREETDADRPPATLDAVAALVRARRASGAEVDLVVAAPEVDLGPLAQLVAHRMVQESLANAAVHAPGARCVVEIGAPRDGWVAVVVRNGVPAGPDPGPGGGFGLVGMAERAQLVGADLTHGPTADGGWEVRLTLPLGETVGTVDATAPRPEAPA
ncbi:sensor histidine kinase [Pseudonocardia sp. TMWB2A]|uniref:sensor histidine kinase n=1 Tax=Pseudonocardia sp. TMWB2A TaxID=687430 RepID=UPI00307E5BE8